jgi:toxin ParE1/3/4
VTIRLVLFAAAEADLAAGADWYDSQSLGLGDSFIEHVDEYLVRLPDFPVRYQLAFGDVRRVVLPRFPYLIGYRLMPDLIEIIGIVPCRADPQVLIKRAAARSPLQ